MMTFLQLQLPTLSKYLIFQFVYRLLLISFYEITKQFVAHIYAKYYAYFPSLNALSSFAVPTKLSAINN